MNATSMDRRIGDRECIWACLTKLIVATTQFTGCETSYGVERFATLQSMPDIKCVSQMLRQVPAIERLQDWGVDDSEQYHARYQTREVVVHLAIIQNSSKAARVSQSHLRINRPMSQNEAVATLDLIRKVEAKLESECRVVGLQAAITEGCPNTNCRSRDID